MDTAQIWLAFWMHGLPTAFHVPDQVLRFSLDGLDRGDADSVDILRKIENCHPDQ
jgi:hypothetical protein